MGGLILLVATTLFIDLLFSCSRQSQLASQVDDCRFQVGRLGQLINYRSWFPHETMA